MCFYGVGNHGGGPTREAIDSLLTHKDELNSHGLFPEFSSLEDFFTGLRREIAPDNIPVINHELQHHARGCYSVLSDVKYQNRRAEHLLMNAERFATAWWLIHQDSYPTAELENLWKDLLYNQFHDILAGTSLESSYNNTRDQLGKVCHCADVIINGAIQRIARDTDTSSEGNSVIVFNPLCWPVSVPVTAPHSVNRYLGKEVHLADASGKIIPCQEIRGERIDHVRYRFMANLPAFGYRVYTFRKGLVKLEHARPLLNLNGALQNHWWTLRFDPHTGEVSGLKDNLYGLEVLRRGHILSVMTDHSDTWSHDLKEYRVEAGRFSGTSIHSVEQGDVQCTLRLVTRFDRSTVISEYT